MRGEYFCLGGGFLNHYQLTKQSGKGRRGLITLASPSSETKR